MAKNNTKLAKVEAQLATARKSARAARQGRESTLTKLLTNVVPAYLGGAAEVMMPQVMGMPTRGVLGVGLVAAGAATGNDWAINAGIGNLSSLAGSLGAVHFVNYSTPAATP